MSIKVTLLTFNKRENSTKIPTSTDLAGGAELDCLLIDDTSLMNPTFKFNVNGNPVGYNYCYVPSFERYFFINDWSSSQGFWYASCTCDVLGSWRTEIGAGSHYVLRAASESDGYIIDEAYPAKCQQHSSKYVATNPLAWSGGHSYVLGIVGYAASDSDQIGSVTYYHMDEDALQAFIYFLMHDVTQWSDIATAEYDGAVQEALLNPLQYIVSCMALPVSPPASRTVNDIYFGYYRYGVSTGKISELGPGSYMSETVRITKPSHPQAASRGVYMNGAPYTNLIAHVAPFGDIELDPSLCITSNQITFQFYYSLIDGIGRLAIYPANDGTDHTGQVMYVGCTQIGAQINLSQVLKNPLDAAENRINAGLGFTAGALSLLSGNFGGFTSALGAVFTGMGNAVRLKYPNMSGKGSTGSFISFFDSDYGLYLKYTYYDAVDDNNTEIGRPLCKVKTINTLSGYVLCQNADCIVPGTHDESDKINGYLNSGFFWE